MRKALLALALVACDREPACKEMRVGSFQLGSPDLGNSVRIELNAVVNGFALPVSGEVQVPTEDGAPSACSNHVEVTREDEVESFGPLPLYYTSPYSDEALREYPFRFLNEDGGTLQADFFRGEEEQFLIRVENDWQVLEF